MERDGKVYVGVYAWTDVHGIITPAAFVLEGKALTIDRDMEEGSHVREIPYNN